MKKILFTATTVVMLSQPIMADFLVLGNIDVGAVQWSPSIKGQVQYVGEIIDVEKDLGYTSSIQSNYFWATIEHPVPFLPNLKIIHTSLNDEAIKDANITFDDKDYLGTIKSEIAFDQTDFILYYQILNNWVNLDLGLNVKYLDGIVKVENTEQSSEKSFDEYIPMIYVKAAFEFPFSGLSAGFDMSYIAVDESNFSDIKVELSYQSAIGLGAVLGYRVESLDIDDINGFSSDIDIEGAYAGLFYHF